jgi:hypothetical membrane protein
MATASQLKLAGAALLVCGSLVAVLVALHPEGLRAPAWVAYLAAAVFACGGAVALARACSKPSAAEAFVCLVLGGMLAIAAWISIGSGSRQCVASGSGAGVPELACRSAFGVGALVLAGMLLIAVRGWLRRSSAG